jgi:muramidase (phage lysozyme)
MNVKPLLDFIAQPESRGDYNVVWGGIAKRDRPKKPLVAMTIKEVLDWQESIDARYPSEAAGRYQIMEDTLRPLPPAAGLLPSDLFSEANQDKLATVLLKRRGLDKYLAGDISTETFANALAHEWASLPMVSGPKEGRSAYAGDGLNKSHVSIEAFLAAVRAVKKAASPVADSRPADPVIKSPWAALIAALLSLFRKGA